MVKILCIDDDQYLSDMLRYALEREGYHVLLAHNGSDGLRLLRAESPDLTICDVNLPDTTGFKLLETIRTHSQVPVIMLTGRGQDDDVLTGLNQGADDYVVKPFSMQVLVTRIKAVLRRATSPVTPATPRHRAYRINDAEFNPDLHVITVGEDQVELTPMESRLLHLLFMNEGQVLSPDRIMERIWGYNTESDVNVVKTHVSHLRDKLRRIPGRPEPIRTVPGAGYMLTRPDTT